MSNLMPRVSDALRGIADANLLPRVPELVTHTGMRHDTAAIAIRTVTS